MNKSSIENPIEIMRSIVNQFDDAIINQFNNQFIDILTYRVSGDIDKLVSLAKRRATFYLITNIIPLPGFRFRNNLAFNKRRR